MTIDPEHECEASDAGRELLGELLFEMKQRRPPARAPMSAVQILALFASAPVGGGGLASYPEAA